MKILRRFPACNLARNSSRLLGGLAALCATAAVCPAASTVVAHYGMGETEYNGGAGTPNGGTAGTLFASTGSNMVVTGTPILTVGAGASNAFGSATGSTAYMTFDGDQQHYQTAPNLLGSSPNAWMMETWVRPQAGDAGLGLILSNGHGGTGVVLNYNAAANKYGIFFGGDISSPVSGTIGASGVGTNWDHLALVYESSVMTLYVNGVSAWTGAKQGTAGYFDGSAIGSQFSGGAGNGFKGAIDDVYFSTVSGFNLATDLHITAAAVPEPTTYGLFGAGTLAGLAFVRRRRHAGKVAA